jgi:uncharacterized protein (TIGR00730 family)
MKENKKIIQPSRLEKSKKAYDNVEFLHSSAGREIRLLSEYQHPLNYFTKHNIKGAIIFFGSARIHPNKDFDENNIVNTTEDTISSNNVSQYYSDAYQVSKLTTEWLETLPKEKKYLICTGGGPGIMEAANRGSYFSNRPSIGLNISLPHEQMPNIFIDPEYNFEFHYFFMRKFWFVYMARLIVVFPGGFGTLDELMEILTLKQTRKISHPIPIILYSENFWKKLINFEMLIEYGLISSDDMNLFKFANTPEETVKLIKELIII